MTPHDTATHPPLAIAAKAWLRPRIPRHDWGPPRIYEMATMGHAVFASKEMLQCWLEESISFLDAEVAHTERWSEVVYHPNVAASRRADRNAATLLLTWLHEQPNDTKMK